MRCFKRRSQESTCAPDINRDHCIASSQERCLELKVDQVDGAAIGEALERPAQPHAPHVSSQDTKLVTNTPITFKVSCTLQHIHLECRMSLTYKHKRMSTPYVAIAGMLTCLSCGSVSCWTDNKRPIMHLIMPNVLPVGLKRCLATCSHLVWKNTAGSFWLF